MSRFELAWGLRWTYAITIFLSAFLLFQVQPLLGKFILPWFGGSPAVWTTCMLVFQTLLFGGYAYAHATSTYLTPRQQSLLHIALLLVAATMLPIAPNAAWKPDTSDAPALRIILLTVCCVGLPYFILSSTGPLVQSWFCRTHPQESPYRLYALSNLGSLLALVTYPFIVEPAMSTTMQAAVWSSLFLLFALTCGASAALMGKRWSTQADLSLTPSGTAAQASPIAPSWGLRTLWFGLAMTPSVMLLATTNQVCQDVAVIPFLWVAPLTIYLLTFILSFDGDRWYSRRMFTAGAAVAMVLVFHLLSRQPDISIVAQVAIYFSAMFFVCMICHRELAAMKPDPQYLTGFYLTMSAGGAAGGLFVGLAAPLLFTSFHELHLSFVGFCLLYLAIRMREDNTKLPLPPWAVSFVAASVLVLTAVSLSFFGENNTGLLEKARNFYGILRVRQQTPSEGGKPQIELVNGRVIHGSQFANANMRSIPTAYYGEQSGIGQVLRNYRVGEARHVGVIGLGIGTLATYGTEQDCFRFYEIIPDVIMFAKKHFTFLRDSRAKTVVVSGDARLLLEHEPSQQFDILVLDAFSGDAIPLHLLTKEAMAEYVRHLKPDGILACHISNLHFDLQPVMVGLASEFGFSLQFCNSDSNEETATKSARWCLMYKGTLPLELHTNEMEQAHPTDKKPVLWTDERSNLLDVL